MEHRVLGRTGLSVAILGFGGAEIGYERTEQQTVDTLLNAALDAGMNVIDTAECYLESEEQIARAVAGRRKDYLLFTKCGHWAENGRAAGWGWTKEGVIESVERSLKRLRTDAVDLVQLHSCSLDELKRGACIEGLDEARKQGKARFIGYSGDSAAARFAVETGRFDTLQTSVNICDQESIGLTLPLAKEKGMGVIVKRTIANAVWRYDAKPDNGYHQEYWGRLQELKYDFATGPARDKQGPDGPAGIAMRFTAMQPGVSVMLIGTSKPERWRQNAELMAAGPLSKAAHDAIRARWTEVAKPGWVGQI
ncbi:MAG: aldo/keto reductase [Phycisphaerae bacterium]|nr:aldo/keto reductase [Phycisphaerae bacterium]